MRRGVLETSGAGTREMTPLFETSPRRAESYLKVFLAAVPVDGHGDGVTLVVALQGKAELAP